VSSRRYGQLAIACVIVSATFCVAPSSAEQAVPPAPDGRVDKDPAKLIKSLEDLLKGYEQENAALRAQVAELEARVVRLQRKAVMLPQPNVPGQSQVPPGWQPFQFNGMTYYVVPLSDGQGAPARPITLPAGRPSQIDASR
jgi:hypothetical protein